MTETQKDDLNDVLRNSDLLCPLSLDIPQIPMTLVDGGGTHGCALDFDMIQVALATNATCPPGSRVRFTSDAVCPLGSQVRFTRDTFIARAESSVVQTQERINEQIDLCLDRPPTNQPR